MSPIVKLDHVYKSFGANQVLKGVSFEVAKGEMIAISPRVRLQANSRAVFA